MNFINGPVTWGIIGCGDVCEVKSGPAFNKVENSKLVAVMRRNLEKAKDYAMRHNVSKFYDSGNDLINDPEVNAIYIATPPASHEEYTIQAMKAGKPVYVEKPITVSSQSCERMIEASHKYKVPVSVAHYRRGLPLFRKAKSIIEEGRLGKIRLILITLTQPPTSPIFGKTEDNWRLNPSLSGGGIFHDLSPHQLDILYWIFGAPKKVYGGSLNQAKMYNAPDLTSLQAVYQNDVYLNGIWSFNTAASATEETCQIIGEKGMISFAFFRKSVLEIHTDSGSETLELPYPENIQHPMIADVVKFFNGEGPNPCSLEDALVTMRMMDSTLSGSPAGV